MARVVVVGAGFAGLTVAARLAKLRHSVTLVERTNRLGGELLGVERDGVVWQAHREAVTLPGVFRDFFRKSGRQLDQVLDLDNVAGRAHLFKDKSTLHMPMGARGDQSNAITEFLGKDEWSPWIDSMAPVWDSLRRVSLDRVFRSRDDFGPEQWKVLRARRSLKRTAKVELRDYYLRKLIVDPPRLSGQDRRTTPGFVAVSHYVERNFGLWCFAGGRAALADALVTRLGERKVDVELDTTATGLTFVEGKVTAVETESGRIPAEMVVWCAPSSPSGLPRPQELQLIPSSRTYLALSGDAPELPPELFVHSNPPLRAWSTGPSLWTVEHHSSDDPLITLARLGIDLRPHVELSWNESPSTLVRRCHWGWKWQRWTTALDLPGIAPVGGLYMAGAHAHPGSSLEMIGMATASIAGAIGPAPR